MKKIYASLFLLMLLHIAQAQFGADMSYNLGLPQGKMASNINAVHQFRLGSTFTPKQAKMLTLGVEVGMGNYANLRMPTTFSFGNGNPTSTFVNYSSNTFQANATVSIDLLQKFIVTPYLIVKGGYQHWYSNIFVEDPEDIDGCRPLERKSIIKDGTMTMSFGGGLRYELFKNNRGKWDDKRHFIDLQITSVRGGSIDYINSRKLKDHDHASTTPPTPSNEGKPVEVRFINVQSNIIHNHQVAELYTTPLRLVEFKLGYHIRF